MLDAWNNFKGWEVIEFFLSGWGKTHVRGVARKLKLSPSVAQHYLASYCKEGLLEKEKFANTVSYRLKETPLALELKRMYFISLLPEFTAKFIKENQSVATLALYGSHAKGTYDEKSDVDLLAISQKKEMSLKSIRGLEKKIGKEVKIQVFSLSEWDNLLEKNNNFAHSVLRNNVLLHGAEL